MNRGRTCRLRLHLWTEFTGCRHDTGSEARALEGFHSKCDQSVVIISAYRTIQLTQSPPWDLGDASSAGRNVVFCGSVRPGHAARRSQRQVPRDATRCARMSYTCSLASTLHPKLHFSRRVAYPLVHRGIILTRPARVRLVTRIVSDTGIMGSLQQSSKSWHFSLATPVPGVSRAVAGISSKIRLAEPEETNAQ